jgi:hypothetical protein
MSEQCEPTSDERRADLVRDAERWVELANGARCLVERHRARYGSSPLLETALRELDDLLAEFTPRTRKGTT